MNIHDSFSILLHSTQVLILYNIDILLVFLESNLFCFINFGRHRALSSSSACDWRIGVTFATPCAMRTRRIQRRCQRLGWKIRSLLEKPEILCQNL